MLTPCKSFLLLSCCDGDVYKRYTLLCKNVVAAGQQHRITQTSCT